MEGIDFSRTTLLFTDGSCSGNPGAGGFGAVVLSPSGHVQELGGKAQGLTTNNQMEMVAVLSGLRFLGQQLADVLVLSDSTYVLYGVTQWMWGWQKRDWTSSTGERIANVELWKQLLDVVCSRRKLGALRWGYVRGHSEVPGNERCDEIAVSFAKNQRVNLYKGPLLSYDIPLLDLPESLSLPVLGKKQKKSRSKKEKVSTYLSYVNGKFKRHESWKACESCVKGRSGARFKKVSSKKEEELVKQQWGVSE